MVIYIYIIFNENVCLFSHHYPPVIAVTRDAHSRTRNGKIYLYSIVLLFYKEDNFPPSPNLYETTDCEKSANSVVHLA